MTAALATGNCVGRTRDGRPCSMRATTTIDTPLDGPESVYARVAMHVCGTHHIVYQETAFGYGPRVASIRVLTGRRT